MKTKYRIVKEKFRLWGFMDGEKFVIQKFFRFHNSLPDAWHNIEIDGRSSFSSFEGAEMVLMRHVNPPKEESSVVKEYEF